MMIEDMKQDHDFHYAKLYKHIPKEYHEVIDTADHFTSEKMAWIRKRILDKKFARRARKLPDIIYI